MKLYHVIVTGNANDIINFSVHITLASFNLYRQDTGERNVQRLRESIANLEAKVMTYEQQIQELSYDLDMLVCLQVQLFLRILCSTVCRS